MVLNKDIRHEVESENYIMFKKFIKYFTLNQRIKRSSLIVSHNIFDLVK